MTKRRHGNRTPPPGYGLDDEPTIDEAREKGGGSAGSGAAQGKTLPDADAPRIPGGMRLRVESGPHRGWEAALLPGDALTIGRNPDNSLPLGSDDFVSRKHCLIMECADRWMVFDLGSENGTCLNGTRVDAGELKPGCFVRVGSTANPTIIRVALDDERTPTARGGLLGTSTGMLRVFDLIDRYAPSDESVMIFGESGTGKEGIARALHDVSGRKGRFVPVNCGALPDNLMESELFGHVKGAFSGADADKLGLFEQANRGTIFLDEIGELPLELQPKLLRVLEERAVRPVGASAERTIDVRVVAATNCDLRTPERPIRIDLYNRLAALLIHVPPLRLREGDALMLAEHFVDLAAKKLNRPRKPLSDRARATIEDRPWTGNVRELRNAIARAMLDPGDVIEPEHLFQDRPGEAPTRHEMAPDDEDQQAARRLREAIKRRGSIYGAARMLRIPVSSAYAQAERAGIDPPSRGKRGRPKKR